MLFSWFFRLKVLRCWGHRGIVGKRETGESLIAIACLGGSVNSQFVSVFLLASNYYKIFLAYVVVAW